MADDSEFLDDPEFQSLLVGCLQVLEPGETKQRSVQLIVLGVLICLAGVVTYIWVLVANQWNASKELPPLAVGVILGIGMIIRRFGVRG